MYGNLQIQNQIQNSTRFDASTRAKLEIESLKEERDLGQRHGKLVGQISKCISAMRGMLSDSAYRYAFPRGVDNGGDIRQTLIAAFENLERQYVTNDTLEAEIIYDQIVAIPASSNPTTLVEICDTVHGLCDQLRELSPDAQSQHSEKSIKTKFLKKVDMRYAPHNIKMCVSTSEISNADLLDTIAQLRQALTKFLAQETELERKWRLDEEKKRDRPDREERMARVNAFSAGHGRNSSASRGGSGHSHSSKNLTSRGGSPLNDGLCRNCKYPNHIASECRKSFCGYCGDGTPESARPFTHTWVKCPLKAAGYPPTHVHPQSRKPAAAAHVHFSKPVATSSAQKQAKTGNDREKVNRKRVHAVAMAQAEADNNVKAHYGLQRNEESDSDEDEDDN